MAMRVLFPACYLSCHEAAQIRQRRRRRFHLRDVGCANTLGSPRASLPPRCVESRPTRGYLFAALRVRYTFEGGSTGIP